MWAIGFIGSYNPLGNDGAMKLHYKQISKILQETSIMRKINTRVYVMRDFTQEMCEMNSLQLMNYCAKHCAMILPCGKEDN